MGEILLKVVRVGLFESMERMEEMTPNPHQFSGNIPVQLKVQLENDVILGWIGLNKVVKKRSLVRADSQLPVHPLVTRKRSKLASF